MTFHPVIEDDLVPEERVIDSKSGLCGAQIWDASRPVETFWCQTVTVSWRCLSAAERCGCSKNSNVLQLAKMRQYLGLVKAPSLLFSPFLLSAPLP